ncbi:MAG: CDP-alcohol phosphatidyltransferase family protein, partial [Microcoleaceae cyanobacterium]
SYLSEIKWITPNGITWLGAMIGGPLTAYLIVQNYYIVAVFMVIISGLLDGLDGDLARVRGTTTIEGGILDSVLDRYVDFLIISAVILINPEQFLIPGLIALLGSTLVPYIRARSEAAGKSTVSSIGSRATRTVLIILGILTQQFYILLITLAIISNIAAIHRFIYAIRSDNS